MNEIAPDVFHIPVTPRNGVNVYLVGDVLVDAGLRISAGRIREAVGSRPVRAIALTHAHGDHVGSARALGWPVWAPERDARAVETGKAEVKAPFDKPGVNVIAGLMGDFPAVPVARRLSDGDSIGSGFVVVDTPGHSPGHVSFWRESDRVLLCGDVFFSMNILTTVPGLRQPPGPFTSDPAENRRSERKVAQLEPATAGFGHGPVIEGDAAEKLARFVATLPAP